MDGQTTFRALLILAAGFALIAIVMCYSKSLHHAPPRSEGFEATAEYMPFLGGPVASGGGNGSGAGAGPAPGMSSSSSDMHELESVYSGAPAPVASAVHMDGAANDTLVPSDLLPRLGNTPEELSFAQLYSTGQGDMQGVNFLDAGSMIGLSTRLNRNANLQLRNDPYIPRVALPMNQSTIDPDNTRLPLEIGSSCMAK